MKYRPKVKPAVMGVYEVERVIAKRVKRAEAEYFTRTDLLIHFASMNAERDSLFFSRRV